MITSFTFGEESELHIFHNAIVVSNYHFPITPERMKEWADAIRCIVGSGTGEAILSSDDDEPSFYFSERLFICDAPTVAFDMKGNDLEAIANVLDFFAKKGGVE